MPTIPRESTEYVYITVTRNGETVTDGMQFAITADNTRPTDWTPAVVVDGRTAVLVGGFEPGNYQAWARTSNGDESPVDMAGTILIT